MSTVVRFPMNAWDMVKDKWTGMGHADTAAAGKNASLLAGLSFLRDCLNTSDAPLDAETLQRCLDATEAALNSAMVMERTIINQTLHIEQMSKIASTDQLTGVSNRRGFEQEFQRVLSAATRYNESGVLIYVDLDGFKPVNDTYGHAAGDEMLIEAARVLSENIRSQDLVARLGGDEFAVLLTRTDWENGLKRAEILKHALNSHYVNWGGKHIAVRASFGFQRFGADADAQTLLHKADCAMFEAKRMRGGVR